MAEELKSLLERIQKDAVEKSETEGTAIIDAAKLKAAETLAKAKADADAMRAAAEKDAEAFMARAKTSLEQAARDVVLSVGETINAGLNAIVTKDVAQAMSPEVLNEMLVAVVGGYAAGKGSIEVLLPEGQREPVAALFMAQLADDLRSGVELKSDSGLTGGFRVSLVDEKVVHDFSKEAIADALGQLVRPVLAEILKKAVAKD